jgi:hypothetical protein
VGNERVSIALGKRGTWMKSWGVMAITLRLFRHGASLLANSFGVGFLDNLDTALELRARRGRRLTLRGGGYSWRRCVTLPGKVFLQLICDSLFDHVLNGIAKRS